MAEQPSKNDIIIDLCGKVDSLSKKQETQGRQIAEAARQARDLTQQTRQVVQLGVFPESQQDNTISALRDWCDSAARHMDTAKTSINTLFVATSGLTTNTAMAISSIDMHRLPSRRDAQQIVFTAKQQIAHTLDCGHIVQKALASMVRLGLDRKTGDFEPASSHLAQAQAALTLPLTETSGGITVLIAMRECIDTVLSELLQRRIGIQDKNPSDEHKVRAIGRDLARTPLPAGHFDRLISQVHQLRDDLSRGKKGNYTHERVKELFDVAVTFLNALMDGVDENKLRS
ncbi:MAG TPA: hypothetical protein VKU02_22165 [Gemmataceae bacterium]|nr:hypothetical protein [Gemmataceae bacterium]